jgi:DNA-binding XRE family transcriptional regulator
VTQSVAQQYRRAFCAATRQARQDARFTQEEMAQKLGLDEGTYKNYERGTALPHRFIVAFCVHASITIADLYTRVDTIFKKNLPRH